jgi:hypothetical protein
MESVACIPPGHLSPSPNVSLGTDHTPFPTFPRFPHFAMTIGKPNEKKKGTITGAIPRLIPIPPRVDLHESVFFEDQQIEKTMRANIIRPFFHKNTHCA